LEIVLVFKPTCYTPSAATEDQKYMVQS
jgi:hypothetical protein